MNIAAWILAYIVFTAIMASLTAKAITKAQRSGELDELGAAWSELREAIKEQGRRDYQRLRAAISRVLRGRIGQ